jgi:hypothetical protein
MLKIGSEIKFIEFEKWLDTWNIEWLEKAENGIKELW